MAQHVLIMGPPGSGKGTQAALIAEKRGMAHISTGDMLRAAIAEGTDIGKRVKSVLDRGDLVSDELMLALVKERISRPDAREGGFILDGFPRTVAQADALLEELDEDRQLDGIVLMLVPEEELVRRALGRGRTDDTEDTIRHRLKVYDEQTKPVLAALEGRVPRRDVDGIGSVEEITKRIEDAIDQ